MKYKPIQTVVEEIPITSIYEHADHHCSDADFKHIIDTNVPTTFGTSKRFGSMISPL